MYKKSNWNPTMTHRLESKAIQMTDEEFDEWSSHTTLPSIVTKVRATPIIEKVLKGDKNVWI